MYLTRVLIVIILATLHILASSHVEKVGEEYYSERIANNKTNPKVYDIAHKYIPYTQSLEFSSEVFLFICTLPLLFSWNYQLFEDFLSYYVIVMGLRALFITSTILPKDKTCADDRNPLLCTFTGGCYDKIFSGHFAFLYILSLLYYQYGVITSIPVLVGANLLNAYFILSSRAHYSIDLIVAFFVVSFVFTNKIKI